MDGEFEKDEKGFSRPKGGPQIFTKEHKRALDKIDDNYEEDGFDTSRMQSKDQNNFNPVA